MQRFKNILYVVVPGSVSGVALDHAVALANNNQASLTIVEVIGSIESNIKLSGRLLSTETLRKKTVARHQQILQSLTDSLALEQRIEVRTKVLIGTSFLEIIRQVLCGKHDLVIKTAENGRLLDRVFGSDDMHLLRKCPCPVWLIKPKSPQKYQRILAAVDVGYQSEELNTKHLLNLQLIEMASALASSEFAELHIVNAWEAIAEGVLRSASIGIQADDISIYTAEVRQQHQQNLHILMDEIIRNQEYKTLNVPSTQLHLLKGSPDEEIPRLSRKIEADLVIMGTVARTGIAGFFIGNTAETIINQLDCSVLAVKPRGFQTPVTLQG